MEMCKLSLVATAPGGHIGLQIRLDGKVIFVSQDVLDKQTIEHEFADSVDQAHRLEIEMFGKLPSDTKINSAGEILSDLSISIENLEFDGIALGQMLTDISVYRHDFNGSQDPIDDKFFGVMGCNGTITLEFSSPVYLWMLENM